MIPEFCDNTFLPPGIFETTLDEFEQRFVYGPKRTQIYTGLKRLIADLKEIGCNAIYIDGSYISSKQRPKDVDVCWEMIDDSDWISFAKSKHPILFTFSNNREAQQLKYNADVFPANIKESSSGLYFLTYFQRIKYTSEPKGIILINLQ